MALVDMRDLLSHARAHGYHLPAFSITDLDGLDAILTVAEQSRAPVVLSIDADSLRRQGRRTRLLLTAMLTAARETAIPVVLYLDGDADHQTLIEGIRFGCNGVRVQAGRLADIDATLLMLRDCGVTVVRESGEIEDAVAMIEDAQDPATIRACRAVDRAGEALSACRPWSPVEHVIVYNVQGADAAAVEAMMATGREQLAAIPGVLDVFTGTALTADPKFRYCWLVRFTHPAVIRSYAAHPDHVAFADTLFRPIAGDRITIDYQAVETLPRR